MGSIGIIGALIGRRNGGINALFLTCGLMLLFNPFLLWSISFQLSAGATLGLVLYASPIQQRLEMVIARWSQDPVAKKAGKYLSEYVFFTIAAQIPILPILLHYFHQVPMATLVANPLVLPIQPPLMILSAGALGLAWIHPSLGSLAANLSLPFITLTIKVVEWAGQLDLPSLTSPALSFGLIGIWMVLITLPAAIPKMAESLKMKWKPAFLVAVVAFASLALIHYAVDRPDGNLHLFVSGSSYTPAILLRTPDGQSILLDTGGSVNELLAFIDARVPFPSRRLDAAILLPGKNRAAILDAILQVIKIDQVYAMDETSITDPGLDGIRQKTNLVDVPFGARFTSDAGVDFDLLPESDTLQRVQIRWKILSTDILIGKSKAVIACPAGMMVLIGQDLQTEDSCRSQLVLTSGNDARGANRVDLLQTGWIHLTSDGSNFWLESQK
jgi:ComEC/Rec2-related protein